MRLVDTLLSFPVLLPALTISAVLGPSLPNTTLAIGVAFAILAEAGLSFLGLGTQPPTSRDDLDVVAWTALVPGIAIALTVLGLNMLGDVLRDALDPTVVSQH